MIRGHHSINNCIKEVFVFYLPRYLFKLTILRYRVDSLFSSDISSNFLFEKNAMSILGNQSC